MILMMEAIMNDPHNSTSTDILTTGEVSRSLGISADRVRQLERCGQLPARRTETGVRLFERTTVEEFRRKRERKRSTTYRKPFVREW